jgi:glycosyltransferase involved in cell wall biosynthesis
LKVALIDSRVKKVTLFCTPQEKRSFEIPSADKLVVVPKPWIDKNHVLRVLWYEWLLGLECRKIGAEVLFVSANFGRARFGVPHVTYVRQSLPFSKEGLKASGSRVMALRELIRGWQIGRSCKAATRIICQSSVMKDWVGNAFDLSQEKMVAVYVTPKDLLSSNRNTPKRFVETKKSSARLLYVGSDFPHKKLDTAIRGFERLREQDEDAEFWLTLPPFHAFGTKKGVTCIGYLQNGELSEVYRLAGLLILPSLVESGPQTPLEAMSVGTPVLVADRPYAHDICEDAAVFFDPNSSEDFAEKAIHLLSDEKLRQDLITKGLALVARRRAAEPYKQIVQILIDVANGRDRQP